MSKGNASKGGGELNLQGGGPARRLEGVLKQGDSGPEVSRVVQALISLGYWLAEPTEVFGPKVTSVVKWFQATNLDEHGRVLVSDGWVGPRTLWALANSRAEKMRQHLFARVPEGLSPDRENFIRAVFADHARGTREMPDGSNSGDGVDRFLPHGRPIPWCMAAVSQWWKDATGNYPFGAMHVHVQTFANLCRSARVFFPRGKWMPAPGDVAIWDFGRGQGHAAIITNVAANFEDFTTGGGNETNSVRLRNRNLRTEKSLAGYVRLAGDTGAGFEKGLCPQCTGPVSSAPPLTAGVSR